MSSNLASDHVAPWELYLKARARRPPPSLQLDPNEDEVEPEYVASVRALARSELRLAEIVSFP